MKLICEQDASGVVIQIRQEILTALLKLNRRHNSFFILEDEKGNYIQCAGSKKSLTVEYRMQCENNSFQHFVVGRKNPVAEERKVDIVYSAGSVSILASEELSLADAEHCFCSFFDTKSIDIQHYQIRETTEEFHPTGPAFILFIQIQSASLSGKDPRKLRLHTAYAFEKSLTDVLEDQYGCADWFASDNGPGGRNVLFEKVYNCEECVEIILDLAQQKKMLDHILILSRLDEEGTDFEVLYPKGFTGSYILY